MSLGSLGRYYANRVFDRAGDAYMGITTSKIVKLETLGTFSGDHQHYEGVPYLALLRALRHVPISPQDVFLDYGAGMGRAMAIAGLHPFARIIGIELTEELARKGKANLEIAARRLECRNVELIVGNAQTYDPPASVTVFHFFNPFIGDVLRDVVARIKHGLARVPRPVTLMFANPVHFEALLEVDPWLRLVREVPWPFFEQQRSEKGVASWSYRIYRV